ncbi:MAG TPA: site-specific integrase, partial [Methylomirabilota bacterium]|nr:site-specific integrase [Methylomirabilota bacterium]
ERLDPVKVRNSGRIPIYTPGEIAGILAHAAPELVPAIAIGAFSGLRSAELERLDYSSVDLEGGHVIVEADAAKVASRRIAPLPANAAAWLAPYAKQRGKVWKGGSGTFYEGVSNACKKAGVPRKANALRHSFITYRLAETQNAAQVALEAGNSAQMIFRHYRELTKPADARKWFGVAPDEPANVTRLREARA